MASIYQRFKKTAEKNGKLSIVKFKKGSLWKCFSYHNFLKKVDCLASGLDLSEVKKGSRVAILSENRWEWLASDLALNKLGAISVPIHATANQDTVNYILEDSGSTTLLVSKKLLLKNKNFLADQKVIKNIIIFGKKEEGFSSSYLWFDDLLSSKEEARNIKENIQGSDLASIIYTSGTTGDPKGVMLTNENFLSNIEAVDKRIKVFSNDRFLSFLPLSHVLERTVGSYVPIMNGAMIAYAESIQKLLDNLLTIKPTILICVPRVLEKTYSKIFAKAKGGKKISKKIFFWALKQQRKNFIFQYLAELLVFKKLRKVVFGGKLRFAVSGGASLNEYVFRFFKTIGIRIVEGYGLTETSPIVTANSLAQNKAGTVGFSLEGVELKIAEDKEILVKGKNVMKGYWQKEDATKEVFDEEGWFKTGDLGFLDEEEFLTIIGRKKEIIVTSNGKNIAPEKIEGRLNLEDAIENSLVVGHKEDFLSALIIPGEEIKNKILNQEELRVFIKNKVDKINQELEPYEQIRDLIILDNTFSIEGGELTPTLKLRRKVVEAKYNSIIKKIYKK